MTDDNIIRLVDKQTDPDTQEIYDALDSLRDEIRSHSYAGLTGIAAVVTFANGDTATLWAGSNVPLLGGLALVQRRLLDGMEGDE